MIKFQDDQEKTLPVDARKLFGIAALEGRIVVIRGRAKRDDAGNLTVVGNQLYVRPKEVRSEQP